MRNHNAISDIENPRVADNCQESARQNLCYCERALTVRFYRSFLMRMKNYAPQMIVSVFAEHWSWQVLATQTSTAQTFI